jgi:hypothetical protein
MVLLFLLFDGHGHDFFISYFQDVNLSYFFFVIRFFIFFIKWKIPSFISVCECDFNFLHQLLFFLHYTCVHFDFAHLPPLSLLLLPPNCNLYNLIQLIYTLSKQNNNLDDTDDNFPFKKKCRSLFFIYFFFSISHTKSQTIFFFWRNFAFIGSFSSYGNS